MSRRSLLWAGVLSAGLCAVSMRAQEADPPATPALVTSPMSFIGITPCRVVDTRDSNMPPGYGPPALAPGVVNGRTFALAGQCGIPASAVAVSLNVTVAQTLGTGYIVLYPQDGAFPTVSTLNYVAGQVVANAAIVPLGTNGAIRAVAGVSGTQLIIDTNGYYAASAVNASDTFLGVQSGNATMTGTVNTGIGAQTLLFTTVGHVNTAIGFSALLQNDNSFDYGGIDNGNTAVGRGAMATNTKGYPNLAFGANTLPGITTWGLENVAVGVGVLANAVGPYLYQEAAVGNHALANMGIPFAGAHRLQVALGYTAGNSLTCTNGDNCQLNIFIDHPGGANDRDVIRVGLPLIQTSAYLAGVRGATAGSAPLLVRVDPTGQLGTAVSSVRYKEDVRDMSSETDRLRELRPVTFRYKDQPRVQFGLIAEEVEQVLPDLVVCDPAGQPESVMYDELPAMILNEVQKQDRRLASEETGARLRRTELDAREHEDSVEQRRIEELRARIGELESRQGSREDR